MVRISDILKKTGKEKAEANPAQPQLPPPQQQIPSGPPPTDIKEKSQSEEKIESQSEVGIKISQTVLGKSKSLDNDECVKLYNEAVSLIKDIYDKAKDGREIADEDLKNIVVYVEKFVDQQYLANDNILQLINLPIQGDFIYNHLVNVCIISIDLGIGLGYDKAKLIELGRIAILHDIGMAKFYDSYSQQHRFNEVEYTKIKEHPKIGAEILGKFKNICERCAPVVYQEHERIDGSGYPLGLKEESIDEYAKILGSADMYEALTHGRPYRSKMGSGEVLRTILKSKNSFGRKIMKVLIQRFASPFPVGSNIKLSSGEKGKVIKRNLDCALRPVVEIIVEADEEHLEKTRIIDLAKHPTIYIKGPLEDEEIEK